MKRPKLLFTILFSLVILCGGYAQESVRWVKFADQLHDVGEYVQAIKEYQRILLFSGEDSHLAYIGLGDCYTKIGELKKAIGYYDLVILSVDDTNEREVLMYKKIDAYLFTQNFELALIELGGLSPGQMSDSLALHFYLGLTYFGLNYFDQAEHHFLNCLSSNDIKDKNALTKLMKKSGRLNRPEPAVASVLSALIPGSGQVYAGDWRNGANSLILTGSLGVLIYFVATKYTVLDAFLAIFPWFRRYYVGGIKRAGAIARNRRDEKRNETLNQVLLILDKNK